MADWSPLRRELAIWQRENIPLPLWWRDDDAVDVTPALEQLVGLAEELALPVHVAVIPKVAKAALTHRLASDAWAVPLVHGWAHRDHAEPGHKKAEFNTLRPKARAELEMALATMTTRFDSSFAPIFVPPWNRIHPDLLSGLSGLGYAGLSTFTPRRARMAAPGLVRINTHVDPIDWRGTRGLIDPDTLIAQSVELLQDRRAGNTDQAEPFGFLTHHLVHDPAIWAFTKAYLSELLSAGATPCNLLLLKDNMP